jgi:hypothetical protein
MDSFPTRRKSSSVYCTENCVGPRRVTNVVEEKTFLPCRELKSLRSTRSWSCQWGISDHSSKRTPNNMQLTSSLSCRIPIQNLEYDTREYCSWVVNLTVERPRIWVSDWPSWLTFQCYSSDLIKKLHVLKYTTVLSFEILYHSGSSLNLILFLYRCV